MSEERLEGGAIAPLLAGRWSPLGFDPDRDISNDTLQRLFEAARWAPSCYNEQPWRYMLCQRSADEDAWRRAFDCLVEGNQRWAKTAPVLMAVLFDSEFGRGGDNRWAPFDTGAATLSFCLQAAADGLHSHQMGGFDPGKLAESFAIPSRFTPISMMALGYLGDASRLDEKTRARQSASRERKSASTWAFAGSWNTPFAP